MGDIRFAICPVVRERKTAVAWNEGSDRARKRRDMGGGWDAGGRERMAENCPVLSIDFARVQLHALVCVCACTCNLRAYISRPSRFAGPARASAPQLIKPARNLYRHYTLFCVQKAFTARPVSAPPLAPRARTNARPRSDLTRGIAL